MSEIAEILEENLRLLQSCSGNEEKGSTVIPEQVVKEMRSVCSRYSLALVDREIDFACSLIFSKEFGILKFLENNEVVKLDKFRLARIEALDFLAFVFGNFDKKCQQYAVRAKEICFSMLHRDRFAANKCMALVAVSKILVSCVGTVHVQNLNLPDMVTKLFSQLAQRSKLTPTVTQEILCLLGLIAQKYPEYMINYSEQLKSLFLSDLKLMNSKTKKLDRSVVAGCFHGLNGYLYNFAISAEDDEDEAYLIFSYIRQAINFSLDLSRYDIVKAALMVLSSHASQFGPFIYDNYQQMYRDVVHWSKHQNSEVAQVAYNAMESCLNVIAEQLAQRQDKISVIQFFMSKFKENMQTSTYIRDVAIALRGYGIFAAACKLDQSEYEKILFDILLRAEHLCNSHYVVEEKMKSLPSFMDALAGLLKEINTPMEMHIVILEKLVVFQMEFFPYLPTTQKFFCANSLSALFLALSKKENIFKTFLSKVVFQGLIRAFSHPIVAEVEGKIDEDNDKAVGSLSPQHISYCNYIPLWEGLLRLQNADRDSTLADRELLLVAVYDEIISSIINILSKLDFSTTRSDEVAKTDPDQEKSSSDPVSNLQPTTPKDFRVLVNLVDFFRDLLLEKQFRYFEKWVYIFGMQVIRLSTKMPYVSGFYKLVAVCLKLCTKLNYLEEKDGETNLNKKRVYSLFFRFAKDTAIRLQQYKDDLLASCLQVILALPPEIVKSHLATFIPALQNAFKLGLSYHPLAEGALDALQSWCLALPLETLAPHFPHVLPPLTKFLFAETTGEKSLDMEVSSVNSKSRRGRHKIPLKVFKPEKKRGKFEESKMMQLRLRILSFLGSLGCEHNIAALPTQEEISSAAIAWDITHHDHLRFALPFADLKPQISFDEFLPRVVDLALTASDRRVKIAACELLHSLVLLLVGKGSQDAALQNRKPADKLFKHLFPALLHLSCDVDKVTKELFEPLMFQLIHWFTHKRIIKCEETAVLMESIWEGITEPHDTALRDFSAKCMSEFVKWSIKQSSAKDLEASGFSIKAILRRLYSYCSHPSAYKRLGAALAFNSIYSILREEEGLVKMFTLEILYHLLDNLTIAHSDNKSLGANILSLNLV